MLDYYQTRWIVDNFFTIKDVCDLSLEDIRAQLGYLVSQGKTVTVTAKEVYVALHNEQEYNLVCREGV